MTTKRRTNEEIVAAFRQVHTLVERGARVSEAVRIANITEVTYYRWRQKFDGLTDGQIEWLVELQAENAKLRRKVAELKLDKLVLREISAELLATPMHRRAHVDRVKAVLNISERRACQVLGQNRSTQRKIPKFPARLWKRAPAATFIDGDSLSK